MRANALFHVAPHRVECREIVLDAPGPGEVLIQSRCSAISAGTEGMIFRGEFPNDASLDATIESLQGGFVYPFAYGYALVGKVLTTGPGVDESLTGKTVFAFHPHRDHAIVPLTDCHLVPDGMTPEAALFLPQVETALGLIMDGAPMIGERVLVFGQGLVGFLTVRLLAQFPLSRLIAAELLAWRRDLARQYGIAETVDPGDRHAWRALLDDLDGADLIFELSGNMAALDAAIDAAGFDGRIVVGSWYGVPARPLDLGGKFHRNRLRLISSQVSTLNPALTGRWDKSRRIALAWRMLEKLQPQHLISRAFPLEHCEEAFAAICNHDDQVMQIIFQYRQD